MKEKVMEVLREFKDSVDYERETALISAGVIDSMEWVELIEALEGAFGFTIPMEQLTAENFNSAEAICALMEELEES